MKLTRLQVSELRRFKAPFELAHIQPGLNIFTGANEAGKSTLVRAIRAAFFERHRSTSVDDLRPYGDSAAAPTVELDFDIGDMHCRLTKSFLHKKRCELLLGSKRLEGPEAEDALAEQLGFKFAPKGASREEHWGIPGLLWIEQGSAHAVRDAVSHAADHLRKALDESLGELSASAGDDLVDQIQRQRDEWLTGTGKPRAEYAKTLEDAETLAERVQELQLAVAQYQGQVDQLRQLHDAHGVDAQAQPWVELRSQQVAAQQALQAAAALADQRRLAQQQLSQTVVMRELLTQRLAAAERQRHDLGVRQSAWAAAASRREQAQALETQAAQRDAAAAAALQAALQALSLARQEDNRVGLMRQARDAQSRAAELTDLLARATSESDSATRLRRQAAKLQLADSDLTALRDQNRRLNELRIRQDAVATRLRFELAAGASVDLAGESIRGQAERQLVSQTVLSVPGIGRIHITPGGTDLAELAQTQADLQDKSGALLQRLGLASLADAEARDKAHAQHLAEAKAADNALRLLAPKGLDALTADLDAAQARAAEAAATQSSLPPAPPEPALPLASAVQAHETAREWAEQARQQHQAARHALLTATSELETAQRERDTLKAALDAPQLQAELAKQQRELVEVRAREVTMQADINAIDQQILQARPDTLQQDVERFKRSAEQAEQQHQSRGLQMAKLQASLEATGGQGLEEELASAQSASSQAQRRAAEMQRRAEALDFLLNKLAMRRQVRVQRLQAPLQKHLDHYLQLLFPSGSLAVDENLVPGALTRPGPRGPEAGDFESLSFGAREQMGVISRLAYADLLKAAGRPTLIILDDALVHSDAQRLAQMKRVLFDAAQRHQVLLFTCHPGNWRDMGVEQRSLHAEPVA